MNRVEWIAALIGVNHAIKCMCKVNWFLPHLAYYIHQISCQVSMCSSHSSEHARTLSRSLLSHSVSPTHKYNETWFWLNLVHNRGVGVWWRRFVHKPALCADVLVPVRGINQYGGRPHACFSVQWSLPAGDARCRVPTKWPRICQPVLSPFYSPIVWCPSSMSPFSTPYSNEYRT